MLTVGEALSAGIKYGVNAGTDSAETDQKLRDRGLFFLNQIAKKTWLLAPLWYRLASAAGSVSVATDSGSMPADFSHPGTDLQVFDSDDRLLEPLEPGEFYALRERESGTTASQPSYYTLGGKTALGVSTLQVHPAVSSAVTLTVRGYVRRMPDLIDRPNKVTTAEGAAGNPNGAYLYKVTFVNALGETEPGVVSTSRTVVSKKIELSAIPVSTNRSVTSRKIYRTAAGGSTFKLVDTIADNSTTTFSDNVADGSLGATAPTVSTAVTGIEVFPEDLIETVLLEGLIAKFQESQGDLRAKKRMEDFEGEIKRGWAEHRQGRNAPFALPAYGEPSYAVGGRTVRDRLQGN